MIDAHQHYWRLNANGCTWPDAALPAIHRDFGVQDWLNAAAGLGVTGSVLVQSQPDDRDTEWLLHLAEQTPEVLGVVGWVDLASPDATRRILEIARRPKARGLRPMLTDLPQEDWILQPLLEPAIDAMVRAGLVFDALILPQHIAHIVTLADRWPRLQIVIDHAAKPDIAGRGLATWSAAMTELAARPQVVCKLSGLMTKAEPGAPAAVFAPYIQRLLELFGPNRLMWGSDWPVMLLGGSYEAWLTICKSALAHLDATAQHAIFEGVARRVYNLDA